MYLLDILTLVWLTVTLDVFKYATSGNAKKAQLRLTVTLDVFKL